MNDANVTMQIHIFPSLSYLSILVVNLQDGFLGLIFKSHRAWPSTNSGGYSSIDTARNRNSKRSRSEEPISSLLLPRLLSHIPPGHRG